MNVLVLCINTCPSMVVQSDDRSPVGIRGVGDSERGNQKKNVHRSKAGGTVEWHHTVQPSDFLCSTRFPHGAAGRKQKKNPVPPAARGTPTRGTGWGRLGLRQVSVGFYYYLPTRDRSRRRPHSTHHSSASSIAK